MGDDGRAVADAEPTGSPPGSILPEPLRKGLLTAIVALVLAVLVFLIVSGTESLLLTLLIGFVTATVLFTTVYVLASG